ncbi:hypothetical protein HPP92_011033 [Vanilla planifolia]|uniref:Uncharacterized protein n=1 Tax=Vanilla planifolia TaxID=51239 RepID=A0A835V1E3_VANPL|nr:hypothetical protein HPP92_011033 [Vanilla planifolia]
MFLLRNTHPVVPELPNVSENEVQMDAEGAPKPTITLAGLIAEDHFAKPSTSEDGDKNGDFSGGVSGSSLKDPLPIGSHSDVTEDEGWITILKSKLPDDWSTAPNANVFCSLDRPFVFSGEQLHILVCLRAARHEEEIITPFKIAASISKNVGNAENAKHQNEASESSTSISSQVEANGRSKECTSFREDSSQTLSIAKPIETENDITVTKSLLQKEGHKQQIETLLEKFRHSNFFVRVAESDEPLWSKRNVVDLSSTNLEASGRRNHSNDGLPKKESSKFLSAVIDQGTFDCSASGGAARDAVKCHSLPSGDILVLLQVNVAVSNVKDPVLEVLQFEKYKNFAAVSEKSNDLHSSDHDPYGELLNWLLPLDRSLLPPHPLSTPLGPAPSIAAQRSTSSSYAGSQIFSFGHFRSYSMSSLPQVSAPASAHISRPSFDLEDFDRMKPEKPKSHDGGDEGLLSFRGVPLVPERFAAHCGLEGIYLPGRRWRRKLEIIQPLEIRSFAAACSTEDLLCVQIKNVSPAHLPDVVIFLDAITIIYEEASKGDPPFCLPISSVETGNGHSLPNLPLRRDEEHSFILKPAAKQGGNPKGYGNPNFTAQNPKTGANAVGPTSKAIDTRKAFPSTDQYAILVSCRCNYTESKLFFKQTTSWRPHVARDLMVSVVSEMSKQSGRSDSRLPQLPVQVLTLHASNLTSEDLTLTVLAPLYSTSSPSVLPLSSTPTSSTDALDGFPESTERVAVDKISSSMQRLSSLPVVTESQKLNDANGKRSVSLAHRTGITPDFISSADIGCTHLWLQSRVPLGCVPARSSATVKLELLPLTDGIITLDTLQLAVQEKGVTYTPEEPLKIYSTSSVATGIA